MLPEDYFSIGDRNCRPNDGAEVLGVLDLVQGDRQKLRLGEELGEGNQLEWWTEGHHALVICSASPPIECGAIHAVNVRNSLVLGEPHQCLDARRTALVDGNAVQMLSMSPDRLPYRLTAHDKATLGTRWDGHGMVGGRHVVARVGQITWFGPDFDRKCQVVALGLGEMTPSR